MSEPQPKTGDILEAADQPDDGLTGALGHGARPDKQGRMAALTLGALGVVFGDIGTSPMYAMRESVRALGGELPGRLAVMGALSLIVWSLILVVTVKYVTFIMRADNDGEGGVLALASLAHRSPRLSRRMKSTIGLVALIGLALFFGDGMLTPAITVLSAVEGLAVESASFQPLVIPLALAILVGLFAIQSGGTAKIGRLFGPVMALWFAVLALLGMRWIVQAPSILLAANPWYGLMLFAHAPGIAFVGLGAIVLAVTGCEALYADMGHFGKGPIRNAWLYFVLPALLINYFGQGALLLKHPEVSGFPFYALAPHWGHYPLVMLTTVASIIASQAVISGVFSVSQQAVQLGRLPRMEIRHTSATDYGQIYVPRMNTILAIGVVLIVLIFHSSSALAAAYGIAVSGVMAIDTFNVSIVAARQWRWGFRLAAAIFGTLALVDLAFWSANTLKIVQGGWLPLAIAASVFVIMETWRVGRRAHQEKVRSESLALNLLLERADKTPTRVAGTAVFLSARGDMVPGALLHSLKHYKVLHERIVIAHVTVKDVPFVPAAQRLEVKKLGKGFFSVDIRYGFFETPDMPAALQQARQFGLAMDVDTTTFFIGRETLVPAETPALGKWPTQIYIRLASAALSPAKFYKLPPNRVVELGTQVTI